MLFNSLEFAGFFALVYGVYRLLPHRAQNVFLLAASYVFYGSWDWRFLSLILASTLIDFWCGGQMGRTEDLRRRRLLLLLSLATNLGLLGTFKYFNFFADSLHDLLTRFGWDVGAVTLEIVLPVGISFYTFQTLSYTIDIYRRHLAPEPRLLNFAVFVAFFPQLVAGPIERAADFLPQVRKPRVVSGDDMARGLWYVFWGLFLKVFVADNLGPIADAAFDDVGARNGLATLIGVYAFAFQIFGDFAGYSSIAIGVARMLGFGLSTNFLFPYWVTNPRDFWRNWHISLSTWLRDYLYVPLGGNRGPAWSVYRNLFLTMLLGGLWHGAAWTFVVWGAYHGGLLIAHRLIEARLGPAHGMGRGIGGRVGWAAKVVGMFHLTCFGWLIFRAPSMEALMSMVGSIVTGLHRPTEAQIMDGLHVLLYSLLLLAVQALQIRDGRRTDLEHLPAWVQTAAIVLMFYSLIMWGSFGASPFIYFQF